MCSHVRLLRGMLGIWMPVPMTAQNVLLPTEHLPSLYTDVQVHLHLFVLTRSSLVTCFYNFQTIWDQSIKTIQKETWCLTALAHAPMHPCTHAPVHTCTHVHMHPCTPAHMHLCTHAHIHSHSQSLIDVYYTRKSFHEYLLCLSLCAEALRHGFYFLLLGSRDVCMFETIRTGPSLVWSPLLAFLVIREMQH